MKDNTLLIPFIVFGIIAFFLFSLEQNTPHILSTLFFTLSIISFIGFFLSDEEKQKRDKGRAAI